MFQLIYIQSLSTILQLKVQKSMLQPFRKIKRAMQNVSNGSAEFILHQICVQYRKCIKASKKSF